MTIQCPICAGGGTLPSRVSSVVTIDGRAVDDSIPCPICAPQGAPMARDTRVSLIADLADELANRLQPGVIVDAADAADLGRLSRLLLEERLWAIGL